MHDEMLTLDHDHDSAHTESTSVPPRQPVAWKQFLWTPKGKLVVGLVLLAVVIGLLSGQVYKRPVTDGLVRRMSQVIPYPALTVNNEIVTIKEFLIEYDALESYFADVGEQTPPPEQLEVAIADTLINKMVIKQLANKYDVTLDQDRVEEYYQEVVAAQESEEAFAQNLLETFGWTPEEFRSRIIESIVLATQMTEVIADKEELQAPRTELVTSAYDRIAQGEDFAMVAQEVHAGFDGIESDLGYVKTSILPTTWADQVNVLEEGQFTEVIELAEGYVIFKLEEKIKAGDDTQLHLFSITVPKVTLENVVNEYMETAKVKRYVGEE